jgi:kynurenine formamidase
MSKQLIDLSHTISHGLITYKGLPAPVICDFLSREQLNQLPAEGFTFFAVPVKVKGLGTFPVRAFAIVERKP